MTARTRLLVLFLVVFTLAACQSNPQKASIDEASSLTEQIALADRLLENGKHEAALAEYLLAYEVDSTNRHVLSRLIYLYEQMGDTASTQYALSQLLSVDPNNPAALEKLGLIELRNGQQVDAKEHLETAAALGSSNWRLLNALGVLADYRGEHAAAQAYYAQGLEQQGADRSSLLNNIGYSYYLSGDLQGALRRFEQSLAISPNFDQALSNKGLTLIRMGRSDEAYRVFKSFMSEEKALNNVGFLHMLFGEYQVAERYLRMAIKASPMYYEEAYQNLDRIEILQRSRRSTDAPG